MKKYQIWAFVLAFTLTVYAACWYDYFMSVKPESIYLDLSLKPCIDSSSGYTNLFNRTNDLCGDSNER